MKATSILFICILITSFVLARFFPANVLALEFEISNASVTGDNIVSVDISLDEVTVSNCPNNICYFQGFLTKKGASKYFGFTENNSGNWIPYQSSPEKTYIKNNYLYCEIEEGTCNAVGKMKFNHDDPKYEGPGEYEVKFARYTGESNSKAGDYTQSLVVNLNVATPAPSPSNTPTPTPTETPTVAPTQSPTSTPTPKPTRSPTPKPSSSPLPTQPPEVMGLREEFIDPVISPTPEPAGNTGVKMPIIAGALVFGGVGFLSAAGYPMFKEYKGRYNERHAKK